MIIVDTSVWIDYFRQSDQSITTKLELLIENNEVVALSCIFGELLQGTKNEQEEKTVLSFWENLFKVDETDLLIEAGRLSSKHKLISTGVGLIDTCILAVAINYNFDLWTFDKKLENAYVKLVTG